jgi:esterase/lipase superfamily enzyme/TRAP-type C4-dicarboxylate transport system substrate-binding protein
MTSVYTVLLCVGLLAFPHFVSAQPNPSASASAGLFPAYYVDEGLGANRRALEEFRALVEEKLGNKLRIDVKPLPDNLDAVLETVGAGKALAAPSFRFIAEKIAPSFEVFQLPYLFPDVQAIHGALDSEPGARLRAEVLKKGFVALGFFDGGFGWVYAKQPLRILKDYKGLRVVAPGENQITRDLLSSLGASINTRPTPDILAAITSGRDDAALLTGFQVRSLAGVKEGAMTVSNHAFTGYALLLATSMWQRFSERDKQLLMRAGREATRVQREEFQKQTAIAIRRIASLHSVYNPSASEREELRQASSVVHGNFSLKVGSSVVKSFETAVEKKGPEASIVPIWYATNRNLLSSAATRMKYGNARSGELRYGRAHVLVPQSHDFAFEDDSWVRRLLSFGKATEDARLRVLAVEEQSSARVLESFKSQLKAQTGRSKTAFVYVHGFKNSFDDALVRAAQISYDIKFPGVTAVFAWPSKQDVTTYPDDEATVEHAEHLLTEFLLQLSQHSDGAELHVLAHSMGNRALMRAVNSVLFTKRAGKTFKFGQIVLAAPDVDLGSFETMSRTLPGFSKRTTVYVSARDKALATSKWLHGHNRAGYAPPISVFQGIDTIDATNIDVDAIGHAYISDAAPLLYDLATLFRYNESPDDRLRLRRQVNERKQVFWRLVNSR